MAHDQGDSLPRRLAVQEPHQSRAQRLEDSLHKMKRVLGDVMDTVDVVQVKLRKKQDEHIKSRESRERSSRSKDYLSWKQYIQERVDQVESMINERLVSQEIRSQESVTKFFSRDSEQAAGSPSDMYRSQMQEAGSGENVQILQYSESFV